MKWEEEVIEVKREEQGSKRRRKRKLRGRKMSLEYAEEGRGQRKEENGRGKIEEEGGRMRKEEDREEEVKRDLERSKEGRRGKRK